MARKAYSFTVLFEPAEEGGYVVTCPALPGLVTEGDTLKEARAMARDAIEAYLESLRKDGLPVVHRPLTPPVILNGGGRCGHPEPKAKDPLGRSEGSRAVLRA